MDRSKSNKRYVNFNELSEEDNEIYNQITVLVKDRKILTEGSNVGRLKPGKVVNKVNDILGKGTINQRTHQYFYTIFDVRPKKDHEDPFDTNTDYCHYDDAHDDYIYNEDWANFIIHLLQINALTIDKIREHFVKGEKLNIKDTLIAFAPVHML